MLGVNMESFTSKETTEVDKYEKSASNIWGNNLHVVNQRYLITNLHVFYEVANSKVPHFYDFVRFV